jgi:hypothetical protein
VDSRALHRSPKPPVSFLGPSRERPCHRWDLGLWLLLFPGVHLGHNGTCLQSIRTRFLYVKIPALAHGHMGKQTTAAYPSGHMHVLHRAWLNLISQPRAPLELPRIKMLHAMPGLSPSWSDVRMLRGKSLVLPVPSLHPTLAAGPKR